MNTPPQLRAHVGGVRKGDLIAASPGTKDNGQELPAVMMKVLKRFDGTLQAVLLKNEHIDPKRVEINIGDVLVNFGNEQQRGKAFGHDFSNTYRGSKEHEDFGEVHFFYKPDDEHGELLWKGLSRAARIMDKHGLKSLYTSLPIVFEAVRKPGPVGMFMWPGSKKIDETPARCMINSGKLAESDKPTVDDFVYVTIHELSHALEFFVLRMYPELIGEWTQEYVRSTKCGVPSPEDLTALRQIFRESDSIKSLNTAVKGMENSEEAKKHLKAVLSYLARVRGVRPRDLGPLLCDADQRSARLKAIWPRVNDLLPFRETEPIVTEYATTNISEFIAEAMTAYQLKRLEDKAVLALCEKSLQVALKHLKLINRAIRDSQKIAELVRPAFEETKDDQPEESEDD